MDQPFRFVTSLDQVNALSLQEKEHLQEVAKKYAFRANTYYLNLIDWNDPNDPIRKLIVPDTGELKEYGTLDASDESMNYVVPGCQHKYATTALLLVSEVCGAYCRYCFRKRLFREDSDEIVHDLEPAFAYLQSRPEINNVLLTGGDPFMLSTVKLTSIISKLRQIDHIKIIRIGSKIPAFHPMRISGDATLLDALRQYSNVNGRIYVITHFNHPKELTDEALSCIDHLHRAGVIMVNQTPVLKGINDRSEILGELLNRLSRAGVTPYYFFMNRPVAGNSDFVLPLKKVYRLVEEAKSLTSGLGKRVKLVMSHASGKIEVLSIEGDTIYLKYHQSRTGEYGKFMILPCPDDAAWFEDLPGYQQYLEEE